MAVGLWMNLTSDLQIWSIQKGEVKEPKLKWHTVLLAENDDEALEVAQQEFAGVIKNSLKQRRKTPASLLGENQFILSKTCIILMKYMF